MPIKVRPGKAAVPEMVPEDDIQYLQLHDEKGVPLDEWLHFDPVTQKATKGPKPKKPKLIPTGSMKQVELTCADCGSGLVAGAGYPFNFLQCGRLDGRDHRRIRYTVHEVNVDGVVTATRIDEHHEPEAPDPTPGGVVECGRYGLLPKDGPLGPAGRLI